MIQFVAIISAVLLAADPCGFAPAFQRADEKGTKTIRVYRGNGESRAGGSAPLAFVSGLKVNTDGARTSYKVDDPRGQNGGINNVLNAMRSGTLADFGRMAANGWEPVAETWKYLSASVIEKNAQTGKPCVTPDGYLVAMTSDVATANGWSKVGDCDPDKWLDALKIPALVLPVSTSAVPSQFEAAGARTRNMVVVMTLDGQARIAYGIVGDKGPVNELGEASVAMNRMLNGLPEGTTPGNYKDAVARFQAPKSIVLLFPGAGNRLAYPITPQRIQEQVKARFDAWGGRARLTGCLVEIPEAR